GVYASAWFPEDAIFSSKASSWLASLIVVVAALAHGSGLKRGTHIQNTVVGIKLLFIGTFLLIAYGCVSSWWSLPLATDVTEPASVASTDTGDPTAWSKALLFANSLTWISLSFSGFNAAVYMTDEIENPRRNVPRAMVLGTLAVSVLYLLLNTVFVYAAPPSEVLGRPDVAMAAVAALSDTLADAGWPLAEHLETLVRVAITLGLATSVLALMQTGPRVYRKMATDQLLPKVLAGNEQSSAAAIALQAGLALIVIWTSTLREQLDYLGFTLSVCAALCCALVLRTPKRHQIDPALDATGDSDTSGVSERVWGFPIVPVIYVAGTLLIATLTAIRSPEQALVGLGTLLVGVISYTGMTKLWGSRNP
ncbi:MAG: APC family permease, partial [Planctomycetota bacterium]